MWHVKAEVAPAILLVVDFGGWYKLDSNESSSDLKFHCSRTSLCLIPIYFLVCPYPKTGFNSKELNIGIGEALFGKSSGTC
ncbi:hypothetical protein P3S68_009345 [Capsicum galapagoense]